MKFAIYQKELKKLVEKVVTAINKNAALEALKQVHFKVEPCKLTLWATDLEQFVIVRTHEITNITDANEEFSAWNFAMHIDDIKVLTKLPDFITLEQLDAHTIQVQSGRKKVTIPLVEEDKNITIPIVAEDVILTVKENWLLETVTGMVNFTSTDDSRPILQVFHFNTKEDRVEAVDSYKLATRTLENQTIHSVQENHFKTVRLHKKCVPVFKKLLDKKSENAVDITRNDKYTKVSGNDFTYMARVVEGEFFKINRVMQQENEYSITLDRENLKEIMKYNIDLNKTEKENRFGIIFYNKDGKLYSYTKTPRYAAFDESTATENTMNKDFCIRFNPWFWMDILNTLDTDTVHCEGRYNPVNGWTITGNEYQFFVLPIHLGATQEMITEEIAKYFK
jgi:DNA polymerase-3 subunit beta